MSSDRSMQELKTELRLKYAQVALSPYMLETRINTAGSEMCLTGKCSWKKGKWMLRIQEDRKLKDLVEELQRLEPAMLGGKVNLEHVRALIIALYASAAYITPPLRMRIKKSAGLFKNQRLRNTVISAKVYSAQGRRRTQS